MNVEHPVDESQETDPVSQGMNRRGILVAALAGLGVGTTSFHRALALQAEKDRNVTAEMIQQAEWIAGLDLTEAERESAARVLKERLGSFEALRKVEIGYDVPPAVSFVAAPGRVPEVGQGVQRNRALPREMAAPKRPESDEALAFLPVTELSALVRTRQVSAMELTRLYLDRLRRFDPLLKCVVTLTEDLALRLARKADAELAAGIYRGPLHGIPWGAKDLIAYPGYPTTWGALPFKDRVIDEKATVARRLEEAGAVLVAKLSLGALAQGNRWFGGADA